MKIKNKSIYQLGFLIYCGIAMPAQAQTLKEVVQKAIADYPSILSAKSKIEATRADIDRIRSQHYPQIAYGFSRNQYASGNTPDSVGTDTNTPSLKLNLWSGGRIQADEERAQFVTRNSEYLMASTLDDVALLATEAYINWAKYIELYELSKKNLDSHRVTFEDIRKIVQIDGGRRIDLEQAQVRLDNAKLNTLQRQAELNQAEQRLRRVWQSVLPEKPLGVAEVADPKAGGVLAQLPASLQQALFVLNDSLPVIAQQVAQVKAAEASLAVSKAGYWPTVDLSVVRQLNTAALPYAQDTFTQIQLNMPLYNGGATSSQVTASLNQLESQKYTLDEVRLQTREKIANAWEDWQSTQARAEQTAQQSFVGDKVVDGYRQQFRLGRRQILDLLNIQAESFNYQSNSTQLIFDEKITRARLLAAMGELAKRFN